MIALHRPVALDSFWLHSELQHHPTRRGVSEKVARLDSVEAKNLKTEGDQALVGLSGVALVPPIQRYPVAQLGAAVLAIDHETRHADKTAARGLDDREGGGAAVLPRRSVGENPLGRNSMGVRVRDGESRVGDLAHSGQPLDIERVVGDEGPEDKPFCGEGGLILHEKENKEDDYYILD